MSSFSPIDLSKPDSSSQTMTAYTTSVASNELALIAAAILGEAPGYVYSQTAGTGTSTQPQYEYWQNGANVFRRTNTWGISGGANGNISSSLLEFSSDTGATYATVHTSARTFDAGGALISTTGGGGLATRLEMLWGKVVGAVGVIANLAAHIATNGTGVHGLGNMSTQAASAVAITGGAIDGTIVGGTTPAAVVGVNWQGKVVNLGNVTGATNVDVSSGDTFYATVTGAWTPTFTNLPPSGLMQTWTIEITNGGAYAITWPSVVWPQVVPPQLQVSGVDQLVFNCRNHSTVHGYITNTTGALEFFNEQVGATYVPVLSDIGNPVTLNNASPITVTVPTFATTAFQPGSRIDFIQKGAGKVTFAGAGGVTINSIGALKSIAAQYGGVTLLCSPTTNMWYLLGSLVA